MSEMRWKESLECGRMQILTEIWTLDKLPTSLGQLYFATSATFRLRSWSLKCSCIDIVQYIFLSQIIHLEDVWSQVELYWKAVDVCSGGSKGARGTRAPPGPKFFQFHAVFGKIWQNRMLAPPRGVGAPSSGKSWIRYWFEMRGFWIKYSTWPLLSETTHPSLGPRFIPLQH